MSKERKAQAQARVGELLAGKYRLLSVLGVGGMGSVFSALHQYTDRRVALKVLHGDLARGVNVQRFLREAKAAAQIDHPRVAQVLDAGQDGEGGLYLAMEHLEGEDLGAHIRRGDLGTQSMVTLCAQILQALEAAHDKGFIHRDIKPGNIFLVAHSGGEVDARLLDFGVARRQQPAARRLTQAGHVVGTPYFMSPEQMCGEPVDARTDLWALGIVLYYGVAGRLPFQSPDYVDLLKQMLEAGPPPLEPVSGPVPSVVQDVVRRALCPQLEARFESARQMRQVLVGAPDGEVPPGVAVQKPQAQVSAPQSRPAADQEAQWAPALDALEQEIQSLEAKSAQQSEHSPQVSAKRRWGWPFSKK